MKVTSKSLNPERKLPCATDVTCDYYHQITENHCRATAVELGFYSFQTLTWTMFTQSSLRPNTADMFIVDNNAAKVQWLVVKECKAGQEISVNQPRWKESLDEFVSGLQLYFYQVHRVKKLFWRGRNWVRAPLLACTQKDVCREVCW